MTTENGRYAEMVWVGSVDVGRKRYGVTPCTGVYVETGKGGEEMKELSSHLVRVCMLKQARLGQEGRLMKSHLVRVCMLKPVSGGDDGGGVGHTLYGCVC